MINPIIITAIQADFLALCRKHNIEESVMIAQVKDGTAVFQYSQKPVPHIFYTGLKNQLQAVLDKEQELQAGKN